MEHKQEPEGGILERGGWGLLICFTPLKDERVFGPNCDVTNCNDVDLLIGVKVVTCYVEAYHHVYDWREKQAISKVSKLDHLQPCVRVMFLTPPFGGVGITCMASLSCTL